MGCFNITASLDHVDDCVVVAGSVHVLGQCAKWSFRHELKAYRYTFTSGDPRNESIPQSVPRFTVGPGMWHSQLCNT